MKKNIVDDPKKGAPLLLLIFYQDWLQERRKEWEPISLAASKAGFLTIIVSWESLMVSDKGIISSRAIVLYPSALIFETETDKILTPAVVLTTWGISGYETLFEKICSLGPYVSEFPLTGYLDGKCELERCLRAYENTTGNAVSRPRTILSDELLLRESINIDTELFILKPSHSGQCRGIEMVHRSALKSIIEEVASGHRPAFVLQDLVGDAFFYHERRWDIRVNILVTSLKPLKYHIYPEGIAKTTAAIAKPGSIALEEWLNAESYHGERQQVENLPLTEMLDYIAREYFPLNEFWRQLDAVVKHTFSAVALMAEKKGITLGRSFIYSGLDFIVQRKAPDGFEIKLLELNSHPGLGWESTIMSALAPQFRLWFDTLFALVQNQH